mmetsp:Transcript_30729/g.60395  ORF Transcript_30729/g.60395 Transcript_30729/m.60395 type:complete len:214 (+) Transcript_30729:674-1315(+)
MCKKVQLEAKAHHLPVFKAKCRKERLAATNIKNVFYAKYIKILKVDCRLILLSIFLSQLLLLHSHLPLLFMLTIGVSCLSGLLLSLLLFRILPLDFWFFLCHRLLFCHCFVFGLLGSRFFLCFILGLFCCHLCLLFSRLFGHDLLVLALFRMPSLQCLLPLFPLATEPVRRLQVFYSSGKLTIAYPLFQVLLAIIALRPVETHLIKAFLLLGN